MNGCNAILVDVMSNRIRTVPSSYMSSTKNLDWKIFAAKMLAASADFEVEVFSGMYVDDQIS